MSNKNDKQFGFFEVRDMSIALSHLDVIASNLLSNKVQLVNEINAFVLSDPRMPTYMKLECKSALDVCKRLLGLWHELNEIEIRTDMISSESRVIERKATLVALQCRINGLSSQLNKLKSSLVMYTVNKQNLGKFSALITGLKQNLDFNSSRLNTRIFELYHQLTA